MSTPAHRYGCRWCGADAPPCDGDGPDDAGFPCGAEHHRAQGRGTAAQDVRAHRTACGHGYACGRHTEDGGVCPDCAPTAEEADR